MVFLLMTCSSCLHVIVDLQQKAYCLRRQLHRTRAHQQRLDHVFLEDIGDQALANVDSSISITQCMPVPQFSHDRDGVQTRIFGKCCRDDLESVGVSLEAVCFHAVQGLRVLGEESGYVDFGSASTTNQCSTSPFSKSLEADRVLTAS